MTKILGKKIGMTQVFTEEGRRYPVTVIELELAKDTKSKPLDLFKVGVFLDITGTSKGKGFQGGMKRWNWSGGPKTHGSTSHRRVGSIGSSATPSRVLKGRHMPGHMGNQKVTIQNLRIIKLDKENNLLVIKGAVPGHKNSKLIIKKAKKKSNTRAQVDVQASKNTEKDAEASKATATPKEGKSNKENV